MPFLCYKQDIPYFLRDYELQGTPREELNGSIHLTFFNDEDFNYGKCTWSALF